MKCQINSEIAKEILENMDKLDTLLTERISDLHEVRGGTQARHAYLFYRSLLWEAKYMLRDNLEEVERVGVTEEKQTRRQCF